MPESLKGRFRVSSAFKSETEFSVLDNLSSEYKIAFAATGNRSVSRDRGLCGNKIVQHNRLNSFTGQ